jgi:hypothetical protein
LSLIVVIRPSVSIRPTSSYITSAPSAEIPEKGRELTCQKVSIVLRCFADQPRYARLAGPFRSG